MAPATTSLRKRGSALASATEQLVVLNRHDTLQHAMPRFSDMLHTAGLMPLRPVPMQILQVNVGKMCNQTCKHCHVDAGPDRKEIMTRETMEQILSVVRSTAVDTVDITGGAPEMNPEFRWFVEQLSALGVTVMVRCNLTIIVANPKYHDLPDFYRRHRVHVVSSLPFYDARNTDRQRGDGVYDDSIKALQMLNDVGYGKPESGLLLDLVYNPVGALLPGPQKALESDFKRELMRRHGIVFNSLHCITNMPISRFLEFLLESGNYASYMEKLVASFNPAAAANVMCRNTISVGWDGILYDCDFNQMLDLPVQSSVQTIADFDASILEQRNIVLNQHCYGCTAGSGSSCGGQLVE
jgi:radical SAM/Cys-rich protein